MSCDLCKGKIDKELNKANEDAERYSKEKKVAVVIYFNGTEFSYMEAKAFFKAPQGRVINCLSPV